MRTLEQLYTLRKQVVSLLLDGKRVMEIVRLTGLSWTAVRKTIDLYEADGIVAIRPAKRGRKTGSCRLLSSDEELRLRKIICKKYPEQMNIDFPSWTRGAVMELIWQECGLRLQVRLVGKYIARWEASPQGALREEHGPEMVRQCRVVPISINSARVDDKLRLNV